MIRSEEGFTLIELLVTIAFIGIVIISFTLVFTNSIYLGKMSEKRNQAVNLAELVVENLQTYNFESADLTQGEHVYSLVGLTEGFTAKYQITDPRIDETGKWDDQGNPLLKTVTVTIEWTEGNHSRMIEVTTYRAKTVLSD